MKSGILKLLGLTASKWLKLDANKAITAGDPGISDVTGLQDALNGKAAASHQHGNADLTDLDASKLTGSIDPARLPVLPSQVRVTSSGDLTALTSEQQDQIENGVIVTTTDGKRWIYTGTGDKTLEASYILSADITPEWDVIAGKPSTFAPVVGTGATDAAAGNLGPTSGQKAALAGNGGTPGAANTYVTQEGQIQVKNYAITSHDSENLSESEDGTYTLAISGFNGSTGFDPAKLIGIWIHCSAGADSVAGAANGTITCQLFGTSQNIWRHAAGLGSYNESKSSQGVVFVPVTAGQKNLVLGISTSNGTAVFTILGGLQAG